MRRNQDGIGEDSVDVDRLPILSGVQVRGSPRPLADRDLMLLKFSVRMIILCQLSLLPPPQSLD